MTDADLSAGTAAPLLAPTQTERLQLTGSVGAAEFPPWICAHGHKLGLGVQVLSQTAERIEILVSGQPALIDAMALACSLGPQEVWVEDLLRDGSHLIGPDER